MVRRSEEIKVGTMVVVSVTLFLSALVFVGGANLLRKKKVTYTTYFRFAGGLEPGSFVRFGGLKVGTVQAADIDPQETTRIRVRLQIADKTPIRTNSKARISTLGLLGENYVEISPGTSGAPLLPPGGEIHGDEIIQLADIFNNANNLTVNANQLVRDLGDKLVMLTNNANQLVDNLNAMTGPRSREHFNAILSNADAMLSESRPHLARTLANLDAAGDKLGPAIDKANVTLAHANTLTENLNTVVLENRSEIHQVLLHLRDSLADTRRLVVDIDDTVVGDRENLDETLENIRATSQNLKEFSDTLKRRPYSLIRVKEEKDRVPPFGK